jgi:hypothetical protein
MRTSARLLLVALSLPSFVVACSSSNDPPAGTTGCTSKAVTVAQQPVTCGGATIVAKEANDYSFSSTITLPPVTVKQMTNLTFDWSGVSKDFLGHTLQPGDLNTAIAMLWGLKLSDLETALNTDELYTSDLVVSPPPSMAINGNTSAKLYDFTINGTALPSDMIDGYFDASMYTPANTTYLFGVQHGTELGREMKMLQAFNVDASSSNTTITMTNTSTAMSCQVSLRNLTITGVPGGTAALMLDWSQMQTNALGAQFKEGYITSAVVGHYTQSPEELEKQFLNLDTIATKYYRANIDAGSVLDFSTLKDSSGASFPGVDDTGTWMVGLICGNCRNPAPWYMTILKPCTQ